MSGLNCQHTQQGIQLVVEDDGSGIAPDQKLQVFERFHRQEGAPEGGNGLGLAIVQRIVEHHAAQIDIDTSKPWAAPVFASPSLPS